MTRGGSVPTGLNSGLPRCFPRVAFLDEGVEDLFVSSSDIFSKSLSPGPVLCSEFSSVSELKSTGWGLWLGTGTRRSQKFESIVCSCITHETRSTVRFPKFMVEEFISIVGKLHP